MIYVKIYAKIIEQISIGFLNLLKVDISLYASIFGLIIVKIKNYFSLKKCRGFD